MYKVGDRVVSMVNQYGCLGKHGAVVIANDDYDLLVRFEDYTEGHNGSLGNRARDCLWMYAGELVLEDIYNSPLFKAMQEPIDEKL